jgi:hydrogenase maturation factor
MEAGGMMSEDELASTSLGLARCFAAGATMWCVAPSWPAHGRHVAVEFVHPVIVGKRALPAVNIEAADLVGTARLLARPDDVLLVVSEATDEQALELLCRAEAWGLTRVWVGAGDAPPHGLADHVVWLSDVDSARAARSGDIVLLYHLLWELTHVAFEHPGLLEADPEPQVCITCSDEARVAEVRATHEDGTVSAIVAGHMERVDVSLVDHGMPGDLLLVHAGVALSSIERSGTGGTERSGTEVDHE